jgi:cobalt-zinc-cadmium efflux system protein
VAILTDALHDLGDSLSLGLSWFLEKYSAKGRDKKFSYGYARFSVLGAFINSLILVVGSLLLLFETIPRLVEPEPTDAGGMILFSLVGIVANGAAVLRLRKGNTLNERVVMIHLMEDVLGWSAILLGSIVMLFVDVPILDPILSLAIMAFVLFNVFRSLRASFRIFLQATPQSVDMEEVEARLRKLDRVCDVHDLHLWTLDGEYNIASLHLVLSKGTTLEDAEVVKDQARHLMEDFHIEHATIEVEAEGADCHLSHQ